MSLQIDIIPFAGWARNLRLRGPRIELIVTLEVGPRVLSCGPPGGRSVFHVYERQAGGCGEASFQARGGHRLWLAPEDVAFTYAPDNAPVRWEPLGDRGARFTAPVEPAGFQKQLDVLLDPVSGEVTLTHRAINAAAPARRVALWALSMMAPGGLALVPQPPLGEHPRDLLPNRSLVLWPYTDLSDPRLRLGRGFFTVQQGAAGPTKIGLLVHADRQGAGWAGYLLDGTLFVKRFPCAPAADYPDRGCNCEIFTDAEMLEVESLGPLQRLAPGEAAEHTERWQLFTGLGAGPRAALDDQALVGLLAPLGLAGGPLRSGRERP